MRTLYHATTKENAMKIIASRCIKTGMDGLVYMADSPENAIKFVMPRFRAMGKKEFTITVIPVTLKKDDESKVIETHDHNEEIFKCKSYGYEGIVPAEKIGIPCDYFYELNED